MVGNINPRIVARIRLHAGLGVGAQDDPSFIATYVMSGREIDVRQLKSVVTSFFADLQELNLELNGAVPSRSQEGLTDVPRGVAYAVTETIRLLRDAGESSQDITRRESLLKAAWEAEVAWSAVLAGDIDDIGRHVNDEAIARAS